MIRLTFRDINNGEFNRALGKLGSCCEFDTKLAYNISRILQKVEQALKQGRADMKSVIEKYAEKDETGKVKLLEPMDGTSFVIPTKELQDAFAKEQEEYLEREFVIERDKLSLRDLQDAKLTPREILVLEPVLLMMETVSSKEFEDVKHSSA